MKKQLVLVLFVVLCMAGVGFAAEKAIGDDAQYRPYTLGEVVVSATKPASETVGTVTRITAADIENSGARTLDEVIDLVPGVYVRMGGAGTPRVDIRGFRTRHVILLLDGIPFNSSYDAQFDPTTIPVENIAEIKVITGAGSLLYGPGGNGGIINIITKKGQKGVHGSALGEVGSENARIGRFTISGASDKFDAFVSGSINKKDGFPLSDDFTKTASEDGDTRENSDFERKNIDANFGYSPGDHTTIGFSANHLAGENGVPGIVNEGDPLAKTAKYDRVDDLEGNAFQLAFSHAAASPFSMRGWLYHNQQDMVENRYDNDGTYANQTTKGAYSSDTTSKVYGANLQGTVDMNAMGNITLALITETHQFDDDRFDIIDKKGTIAYSDISEEYKVHTASMEYGVSPVDRVNLVMGYGFHKMDKDGGDDESGHSWLLGAGYDLFENTRLKASYARKIRFPDIRDLYDGTSGNPDLKAETTDHYEVGITQEFFGNSEASFTVFRIDAEDFIEKDDVTGFSENFEDYRFTGCEIAVQTRPTDNLTLGVSYAYLDSKDESDNAVRDELQHRPKNKYALETSYTFNFGLMLHGDIVRVADQYFYSDTVPVVKKALNDYTLVNLKISQRLLKNTIEAYIGSDNLFDENYEQSYGLPQAGRTYYGGMTYRF